MEREYDIIVWGATGLPGVWSWTTWREQHANSNLKWLSGAELQKLQQMLAGRDVAMVTADSGDDASIEALARKPGGTDNRRTLCSLRLKLGCSLRKTRHRLL